jgi:hypothetical protein
MISEVDCAEKDKKIQSAITNNSCAIILTALFMPPFAVAVDAVRNWLLL